MKPDDYLLCFTSSLIFSYLAVSIPAQAQIASDNSMSVPTQVIRQSDKLFEIIGGTEAGSNLFHSFAEFSVKEENIARFINNNPVIQNVISRVTGASASEIFGRIEAGGSAPNFNLFLLNPNGIIFGPNASLDLKGSFVATTANAIQFGDHGFFSAANPNDPSLLTVQPSAFFFNQVRPDSIRYEAKSQPVTGLKVPDDKSLLLLGGDVTIDGGMLTALNGRVELGGLAGTGTVALNIDGNNLRLRFPDSVVRADASLTNGAMVDVKDRGSGSITINARNIEIARGSVLASGILPNLVFSGGKVGEIVLQATDKVIIIDDSFVESFVEQGAIGNSGDISIKAESLQLVNGSFIWTLANGTGNSGNIIIDIRDDITLKGRSRGISPFTSEIINQVDDNGEGKGGNVTINAKSLSLADAAAVQTSTRGKGDAGNILIRVDDFVSLENTTNNTTQIRTVVESGAIGNGGTIDLNARSLSLTGGSQLAASVFQTFRGVPGGKGKGGDIIVNVSDSANISGVGLDGLSSGIFADTGTGAVGPAGNITVNTPAFRIADGAVINAQTNNSGSGGNIRINANTFEAINGGQLITNATSSGNAGNITVNATKFVVLSGSDPTFTDRLAKFGTDVVSNVGASSGLFAQSDSTGAAGNVTINASQISIFDGAKVSVSGTEGQAGNLKINADSLTLNRGFITAETGKSGAEEGANITLQIRDLLSLANESVISATAFGDANGGNILIDPTFVLVFPPTGPNGSDIIAKAVRGNGGNIRIDAQGIFGIAERKALAGNQSNDIDASSEFGASGQVQINNTVNPNQGVAQIPETVIDPNALVAQNPCKRGSQSQFTRTGRGGLPPNLSDDLSSETTQVGLVKPAPSVVAKGQAQKTSSDIALNENQTSKIENPIIPAQGWTFKDNG
ncbi:MAG: filamentous hemagglutinin N-terminal domain-containing protein, partial [Kovacikia sp.]